VVFSFFKKDPKDAKDRSRKSGGGARPSAPAGGRVPPAPIGRPLAEPVNRSLNRASLPSQRFATTENAIPDRELARSLAMETAAKIDAIESEMARDFLRPSQQNIGANTGGGAAVATQRLSATLPAPAAIASRDDDAFDAHDALAGSIDAIEIHTSGAGSVIDETAILFANGQIEEAEANLRAAIASDDLGHARQMAWLMLFELINQRGDRVAFEQLTGDYARRFESSPPAWVDYAAPAAQRPGAAVAAPAGAAVVRLPDVVDANVVKALEQLKQLAVSHPALTLDASGVRSVDLVGAELLLRVVNAFKRASHELIVQGAEQLINPLRAAIEPGRRDASDACWMLLLEVFRLLGRQDDFDETGIQYCITFEVSPPSWEPAPPNMKARAAAAPVAGAASAVASDDPLAWRGVIEAEGEPFFGRLAALARVHKELSVDCGQLRRMAFSAASALLTLVMKLQQGGATVEFRNVNVMVGALFQLLGITAIAAVQLRRA
jgi:ABC-type transporter Mla MlaB component